MAEGQGKQQAQQEQQTKQTEQQQAQQEQQTKASAGNQIVLTRDIALGEGTRRRGEVLGVLTSGKLLKVENIADADEGKNVSANAKPAQDATLNELRHLSMNPGAYFIGDPDELDAEDE